ncbi:hypothetical protein [Komagataeibacter rhaeticus]|uniref:hypothetical protein n=1 Tax=Komagataeibacter rhaeticus TaxID=215221 RepID=UPI0012ECB1BA|nr:hypothetical protein [Komagataeibacter rhaeticus]MBL7240118.1 hypothetical protein [Komagataeibacter rhaeticus]
MTLQQKGMGMSGWRLFPTGRHPAMGYDRRPIRLSYPAMDIPGRAAGPFSGLAFQALICEGMRQRRFLPIIFSCINENDGKRL